MKVKKGKGKDKGQRKVIEASDSDVFDRSKKLGWFDLDTVRSARVLVLGCGALGNEVVKDLLLSGYRDLTLVDMDRVARSNLNRCVMFTEKDAEKEALKAEALAKAARRMAPDANARPVTSRLQLLDDAFFKPFDLAMGCLDNVEARLHANAHCTRAGIPLVDGGTDGMRGKVQVVLPGGPCIECGMNRSHMKVLEERYSCSGRDVTFYTPRKAAEITTTSIVAALQVREALKIAHGMMDAVARGIIYYDGMANTCDVLDLEMSPTCPNHGGLASGTVDGESGTTTAAR